MLLFGAASPNRTAASKRTLRGERRNQVTCVSSQWHVEIPMPLPTATNRRCAVAKTTPFGGSIQESNRIELQLCQPSTHFCRLFPYILRHHEYLRQPSTGSLGFGSSSASKSSLHPTFRLGWIDLPTAFGLEHCRPPLIQQSLTGQILNRQTYKGCR